MLRKNNLTKTFVSKHFAMPISIFSILGLKILISSHNRKHIPELPKKNSAVRKKTSEFLNLFGRKKIFVREINFLMSLVSQSLTHFSIYHLTLLFLFQNNQVTNLKLRLNVGFLERVGINLNIFGSIRLVF